MARCLGVDGCSAGWFAVWLEHGKLSGGIFTTVEQLLIEHHDAEKVLIDVPIGLLARSERNIESIVRRRLGNRRSSVFPVPCYDSVYAEDYAAANALNRQRLGKGLSKQAWFITPKIREVNDYLQQHGDKREILGECHPELAFAVLARGPMTHSKKTPEGASERLKTLAHLFPDAQGFTQAMLDGTRRKDLVQDDCFDALVLLAAAISATTLEVEAPQLGEGGIPVRMWIPGSSI